MKKKNETPSGNKRLSRRDFLRALTMAGVSTAFASCIKPTPAATPLQQATATSTPLPTNTPVPTATWTPMATPIPTDTPLPTSTTKLAGPTATPVPDTPRPSLTDTPLATATPENAVTNVAIGRASNYDPSVIKQTLADMLDGIGGLADVVRPGARVAIKVNLTGGLNFQPPAGYTAIESYLTHPQVVKALCELLIDAGAGQISLVEGVFDDASWDAFGYTAFAGGVGASLIDLNLIEPYTGYTNLPVGSGAYIYGDFTFNPILEEVDTFISVAKMKCHYNAGVTHAMKNLVGLTPVTQYRMDESHWWRSALHGEGHETPSRLPRVIVDLNRARPIDLALIDGIRTGEGGEVPRGFFAPVSPGVMVVGKDTVATDAVATAIMGFDPQIEPPNAPFLRGDNYLNLASAWGLGTNDLSEIGLVGASLEEVLYPFNPSTSL